MASVDDSPRRHGRLTMPVPPSTSLMSQDFQDPDARDERRHERAKGKAEGKWSSVAN